MTKMLMRYVHEFKDRHGKTRRYVRRRGQKQLPLPGDPGSPEFMRAYEQALAAPRLEIGADKVEPGTVADLIVRYRKSADFLTLSPNTQRAYGGPLEWLKVEHGDKRVSKLKREHVKDMLAKKAKTPTAANALRKMLRLLMPLAIDAGMRSDDPTIGVKRVRVISEGHPPWTEQDIKTFRSVHPSGDRARLAMELALGTMQRRGDLLRMGRQHVRDGILTIRQEKTKTVVELPILNELRVQLDLLPQDQMTFLLNERGRPFLPASFSEWFRTMCDQAGLPHLTVHGLRKSGAQRLAEHGATDHEIAAWGGWRSLSEVQRYTRGSNRRKLAQAAVHKLTTGTANGKPQ
jgi:integrase